METLTRKFHPTAFDLDKIKPIINSSFIEFCFVGEDKYEMVERESIDTKKNHDVNFFKNGKQIGESDFRKKTNKGFFAEKNRVVFLHDNHICFLDMYIKPNYQILTVITVEFGNEDEMKSYEPLEWFGQEVNEKFYNEKALWNSFQAI